MARETASQAIARRQRERREIEENELAARNRALPPAGVSAGGGAPGSSGGEVFTGALRDVRNQAGAAGRGALDTLTFGHRDEGAALLAALTAPGGVSTWRQRYDAQLPREVAQDQYDAAHYGVARTAGQVAGVVLPMILTGGESALASAPRLAGAAARTGREAATALAAGAGVGAGVQHVSDLMSGQGSSRRNDLAAGAAGAADVAALAARLGPGGAGGMGGAVNSAVQDLLNGRSVSLERASQSALAGEVMGGAAGEFGRRGSNALSRQAKGQLGEVLGAVRSAVNGTPREFGRKTAVRIEGTGKYWRPDGRSGDQLFEDKFGYGADLTRNQRLARRVSPETFNLYHFLPDDVGAIFSVPAAAVGPQGAPRRRGPLAPGQ